MKKTLNYLYKSIGCKKPELMILEAIRRSHNHIDDFSVVYENNMTSILAEHQLRFIAEDSLNAYFSLEDIHTLKQFFIKVVETGVSQCCGIYFTTKEDEPDSSNMVIIDCSKFNDGLVVIIIPINRYNCTDTLPNKKLLESYALAAINSVTNIGIILKDINGLITDWNIGAKNILGYTLDEIKGKTTKHFSFGDAYDEIDEFSYRIRKGEHITHKEVLKKHKSGKLIICSASSIPTYDAEGNVIGSVSIFHDNSEKKMIVETHKVLKDTLTNLFNNLTNAFCLFEYFILPDETEDFKVIMGNKAFAQLLQLDVNKLNGMLFSEIYKNDKVILVNYLNVLKTGVSATFENFNYFFQKYINVVIFSPTPGQVAAIITDRTHLVAAEQELRARKNDLALLFSSMTSGFCLCKIIKNENGEAVDYVYEMVNQAFESLEGFTTPSMQGKTMSELNTGEEDVFFPVYVDVAQNRKKVSFIKFLPSRSVTIEVICYSPNEGYFVCIENDISERVRAEGELEKANKDTEAILHTIPAPICVVGKNNGFILGCNTAFVDLCDADSAGKLIGRSILDFFKQNLLDNEYMMTRLHQGVSFKCAMHKHDKTVINVEVYSRTFVYEDQDAFAVFCMDLTKQTMQEEALLKIVEAAEEASKQKSTFLANMSHEIRTPMNGVIGFSELALEDNNLSEATRDYLTKIKVSANGLLEIINDILDISKIEEGKVELEKIPFSLRDVFLYCETISLPKAIEKGINLHLSSDTLCDKKLIGDPTKLKQILLNLLSNAIKFTHIGTVELMSYVERIEENSILIRFEITDTGIGMSKEHLSKILIPFTQADSSTTRRYGGTGLGLVIAKSIIELMGGEMKVESDLGIGSKFSFYLNFETSSEPVKLTESDVVTPTEIKKPIFNGEVLVCEDNLINQQLINEHLIRIGLKATIVTNGRIGLESVRAKYEKGQSFDIILMDIHMPVMDGLKATSKIKKMGITTPIIALTANAMIKDKEKYLQQGMTDYISKPFSTSELWSCLMKYMTPTKLENIVTHTKKNSINDNEAIINSALGLERSAHDESLYTHLKINFYKKNINVYELLNQSIVSGDIKRAHRLAHSLKGVAGLIGATKLENDAYEIELSLEDGEVFFTREQMNSLKKSLDDVLNELAPIIPNEPKIKQSISTNYNYEKVFTLIKKLEPLLKKGDSRSVDLIEQIEEVLPSSNYIVNKMTAEISNYDFDLAYESLSQVKKSLEEEL